MLEARVSPIKNTYKNSDGETESSDDSDFPPTSRMSVTSRTPHNPSRMDLPAASIFSRSPRDGGMLKAQMTGESQASPSSRQGSPRRRRRRLIRTKTALASVENFLKFFKQISQRRNILFSAFPGNEATLAAVGDVQARRFKRKLVKKIATHVHGALLKEEGGFACT